LGRLFCERLISPFVPLGNNQVGFFTVYDGSFVSWVTDVTI
jgi:hypothetical protein